MVKKILFTASLFAGLLLTGCASVPLDSDEASRSAKAFNAPDEGKAGLYIYRKGGPGPQLKKDIWVDGNCVGESAPKVFFYKQVDGGQQHKISTESEFSPNHLQVFTEPGKNYFIKQYIKIGIFVGGANLMLMSEDEGMQDVARLNKAVSGRCSR